ncbi:MAG: LLM class F420-dependent oxidoreductase [Myxococcales bacterium]|nr:LLM class F420-dependent oxidoreductase [Myxococcales bacterium]
MKFCSGVFRVPADEYIEIAKVADEYGWDALLLSDHVLHPERIASDYPYNPSGERPWDAMDDFPDIWVVSGMMAAVTRKLRFMQMVYILPLRDPFSVAKALGTAASLSGYRVGLGLGLGWMQEEFDLLGQAFERRGARADEMLEVMRKLWSGQMIEHHGEFYDFDPMCMRPAAEGEIPIVVGGNSKLARRRVARVGDGWAPAFISHDELRAGLDEIHALRGELGRSGDSFSLYYTLEKPDDLDEIRQLEDIGVTHCNATPWGAYGQEAQTLEQRLDGLKRFGDEVIAKRG